MHYDTIYQFITSEENAYQTLPIQVSDGYEWQMARHIKLTNLYKNSQYETGKSDDKPFKNIVRPILNLQYRTEGFDVKDIELFIDEAKNYFKSFLLRKYHQKWARENDIDTFIDELVETYVDYGGALIKDMGVKPEVVPWQRIAFVDQTDILSGPIAEKHFYSPEQLREMKKKGWKNIEELITMAEAYKRDKQTSGKQTKTPGKYIEVYEVHGCFPAGWLYTEGEEYEEEYFNQLHICAFYQDTNDNKFGITLFKGKEKESPYKLILRDKIYGRALGLGGAEELFEPQVWVNYDVIRMKGMLDQASKIIYQTADPTYANKNKTNSLESGEILIHEPNSPLSQINTFPASLRVFENSVNQWEIHAQRMGAATDPLLGEAPPSGTPFKLQELVTTQGMGIHEYRRGKLAAFLGDVYRDWLLPYFVSEIVKGQEFLAELDLEELQYVADSFVRNSANGMIKELILNGELVKPEDIEFHKNHAREEFMRGGNKRFLKILKDEMKKAPIDARVNIAGKQKNLVAQTDKLVNIFRQIIAAPQVLQSPPMAKLFNQIISASGLDPVDFSGFTLPVPQPQLAPQQIPQRPLEQAIT